VLDEAKTLLDEIRAEVDRCLAYVPPAQQPTATSNS
jgi:hypothetical protein